MVDVLVIIRNIADLIVGPTAPFQTLFGVIMFLLGVIFMIRALMMAARRSELGHAQGSWAGPIATFFAASSFLAFPALIEMLNATFWGSPDTASAASMLAYAPLTVGSVTGTAAEPALLALVTVVQFVGLIAVARGIYMLNLAAIGGQSQTVRGYGPGLTFLISGALAVNFPLFVGAMELLLAPPP